MNEFSDIPFGRTLMVEPHAEPWRNSEKLPNNCKTMSCELHIARLRRKVKRRRYADVNGDCMPVFGIGMVLSVERFILFAICSLVNCYL